MKKETTPKIITAFDLEKEEVELKKKQWKSTIKNKKIQLSFQEKNLLRDTVIKNKISLKDFQKYYVRRETGLVTLHRLLDLGILQKGLKDNEYVVSKKYADNMIIWGE